MSKICHYCGKMTLWGNRVSHAENKTRRRFEPNLQKVTLDVYGEVKKVYVCTKCIKAGKTLGL